MANVLAFAEQRDGEIRGAARETVSVAARLASDLGGQARALVLGGPGIGAGAAGDLGARTAPRLSRSESTMRSRSTSPRGMRGWWRTASARGATGRWCFRPRGWERTSPREWPRSSKSRV